jgi:hypothetical protein
VTLHLEIHGPQVFRFDVPGTFEPRLEPVWKEAANPPEVTEIREVWEVRGARLVASDGDPAAFWREWTAFLDRLRVRGAGYPAWVRLVRVTGATSETVWTLGPPSHERFRIEQTGAGLDDVVPRATWRVLAPVTLVVSAVQRFADPNGIVGWDQETSSRFDAGGLHVLEWRTTITTREGTSALDKVRRFGRIEVAPFGPSYTYDTNGPEGVEVVATDADEANRRVPTRCTGVCRLKQWGVRVGTSGPGTSPTEVGYSVRTKVEKGEASTTIRASARGPGALAWVEGRAPGGAVDTTELFHEEAIRYAEGTWTMKGEEPTKAGPEPCWQIQTEVTGGHADIDFEPVVGGYEPVLFEGGILPWRLTVQVRCQRRGGEGKPDELLMPGVLADPWILDHNNSREQEPRVAEEGLDPASRLWAREAALVYWSARRPTVSPIKQLEASTPVPSYFLTSAP